MQLIHKFGLISDKFYAGCLIFHPLIFIRAPKIFIYFIAIKHLTRSQRRIELIKLYYVRVQLRNRLFVKQKKIFYFFSKIEKGRLCCRFRVKILYHLIFFGVQETTLKDLTIGATTANPQTFLTCLNLRIKIQLN